MATPALRDLRDLQASPDMMANLDLRDLLASSEMMANLDFGVLGDLLARTEKMDILLRPRL